MGSKIITAKTKAEKPKKEYVPLTDEQIKNLLDLGLTQRMVANFIKKQTNYKDILPKVKGKVEEKEAREWLKVKMLEYWPDNTPEHKKNRENFKIPKRTLEKPPKGWAVNDKDQVLVMRFPMLPSVNHMYQTGRGTGTRQLTMAAKRFFIQMQEYVATMMIAQGWEPVHKTKIVAEMWFFFPDNATKDNHNMFKFLFDCMDGILFDNDYHVMPRVWDLSVDRDNPRIEVKLSLQI